MQTDLNEPLSNKDYFSAENFDTTRSAQKRCSVEMQTVQGFLLYSGRGEQRSAKVILSRYENPRTLSGRSLQDPNNLEIERKNSII